MANGRGVWDTWSRDIIPTIQRFLILSGVAYIKGSFCTHPVGNETRIPTGPSLGGALRPGGTNTMIDGLLLPDPDTGHTQWNCSDADLRRHMANEIMKLSSDKTAPSTTATYTTYPFTKVAKEVLFDPDADNPRMAQHTPEGGHPDQGAEPASRDPPHIPAPPHTARARGTENATRLDALHLAIESSLRLSWSDTDTWAGLQSVSQQAEHLGFSIPPWITVMNKVTTTRLLRFDLNEYSRRYEDLSNCTLTHILLKHSPTVPDVFLQELPLTAVCDRLKQHWRTWAEPIGIQCSSISTHLLRSSGTLADAMHPPSDRDGVIAQAFTDCLRKYSDVDDLQPQIIDAHAEL